MNGLNPALLPPADKRLDSCAQIGEKLSTRCTLRWLNGGGWEVDGISEAWKELLRLRCDGQEVSLEVDFDETVFDLLRPHQTGLVERLSGQGAGPLVGVPSFSSATSAGEPA